jgi:uncharacterized integral membrane protein
MLYVAIILFVLVSTALTVLVIQNLLNDVSFSILIWHPQISLGLLLLLAFILGAVVLYIISAASAWQDTRELKRLRSRVAELEQAAANATTSPLPGSAPIVPMPGMTTTDISDMPTQH